MKKVLYLEACFETFNMLVLGPLNYLTIARMYHLALIFLCIKFIKYNNTGAVMLGLYIANNMDPNQTAPLGFIVLLPPQTYSGVHLDRKQRT